MANIVTNMFANVGDWMAKRIAVYMQDNRGREYSVLSSYYVGDHRPQLRVKIDATGKGTDDNIVQNFIGLAVDRSVSRLWRGGVKFKLPDAGVTEELDAQGKPIKAEVLQQDYIDKVWDLNKKEIILHQVGLHGAVYGTPYFKICPDELIDPFDGKPYPRLVPLDPEIVRIVCDPQDMQECMLYQIKYTIAQVTHWEITRRSDVQFKFDGNGMAVIEPANVPPTEDAAQEQMEAEQTWVVEEYEQSAQFGNQITLTSSTPWLYDFPPILHWKNLPSLKSCYGDSDIDDAINVQDKSNFVASNIGKIIKYYAHPQTIGTGFKVDEMHAVESGVGTFRAIQNENAKVFNLEMNSNLDSSHTFGLSLRQSIFAIAREVDMDSFADKLGSLTNFGLHVLLGDAIDKNDTKRQLYGAALKELNRRLLMLNNWTGEDSNPGELQWGEALPINILEEMNTDQVALNMGIVDKKTVAERYMTRFGVDWETIQANINDQQSLDNQNNANIGAQILKQFNRGQGAETMPPKGMMPIKGAQPGIAQPPVKAPVVREMSATGKMSNNSG